MMSYLAFDLGASSSRALLGALVDGKMHMQELHRFTTPIIEDENHLFWDIETIWQELRKGLRLALDTAPDLKSLSVDAWGVDYVPLDVAGNPVRNPYCYRDPRTAGMLEEAFKTLSAATLYQYTGIQFLPFNTLFQLLADQRDDPEGLRQVDTHLSVADFLNYRFCGKRAAEVSMASTSQMMDARTKDWSGPVFEAFGLNRAQWPGIVSSGTLLGPVRDAQQVMTLATCSHDTGCAVAAVPSDGSRPWAYISCGTWSLIGTERSRPLLTDKARAAGFTHEAGVDGRIRFLKNLTGLWALQECAREWGTSDWAGLEQAARQASPLPTRIDLDDPRFGARGNMLGRLTGYCNETGQRVPSGQGQWVYIILESIADAYCKAVNDLQKVTEEDIEVIHLVGGGSQNTYLCALTARRTGLPVVAGPVEATALGNLLIQARTMGDLPKDQTIRSIAQNSSDLKRYQP